MPAPRNAAPAATIDIGGPQLRADRRGYLLSGERVEGFADRPDLESRSRRLLATWAEAFTPQLVSDAQRELLRAPEGVFEAETQLLAAALANAEHDLPRTVDAGLYERLDPDQIRLVREPWRGLGGGAPQRRDYPLATGELAQLTGCSSRQVRYWAESGLLPTYRVAGRRHFFSAAVILAFALKNLERNEVRSITRVLSPDPSDAVPEILAVAAERSLRSERWARLPTVLSDVMAEPRLSRAGMMALGDAPSVLMLAGAGSLRGSHDAGPTVQVVSRAAVGSRRPHVTASHSRIRARTRWESAKFLAASTHSPLMRQ